MFRIEDTDSHRFVPGAEEYIIESFKWLGIKFDEGVSFGGDHGPYRQSERRDIYKKYVDQLLADGKAYYAFNVSFGVFGIKLRKEDQTTNGTDEGSRFSSGANFRFNIFNINFGMLVVI